MKAQATVFKKIDKYVIKVHLSLYMRGKHICIYIEKKIFKQKKTWSRLKIVIVKVIEPRFYTMLHAHFLQ